MNLVVTILIGVAFGTMVELLLPGHTVGEFLLAISLGVAGSLVARYIAAAGGWIGTDQPESFIASALGAIAVLILFGLFFRRNGRSRKH